jgi:hypothetical protein
MNRPSASSSRGSAALLASASTIFLWQLRHPVVRFASPVANELFGFVLGLCLPWLTVVAIFRIGRWWSKAAAVAALLPLLVYSFVFLLFSTMAGFAYRNGHDLSFDRFAETHWKESVVGFYRTNGGATTDFGVVIQQEKVLLPGVLLVRKLDDFSPCGSLDGTATDLGITVTDQGSKCSGFSGRRRDYLLKRFVYF